MARSELQVALYQIADVNVLLVHNLYDEVSLVLYLRNEVLAKCADGIVHVYLAPLIAEDTGLTDAEAVVRKGQVVERTDLHILDHREQT